MRRSAMHAKLTAFGALLLLLPSPSVAQSEGVEVFLTVKEPEPTDKDKHKAPQIEATIVGAPRVPIEKFTLVEVGAKIPYAIKATNLREYTSGGETIAVAFVFNGQEVWIGNDDYEPEDSPARYLGILKNLKTALQTVPWAKAGPAGSKGVLISYGDKAEIKVPMGPLAATPRRSERRRTTIRSSAPRWSRGSTSRCRSSTT
jgi:hypothetical protein